MTELFEQVDNETKQIFKPPRRPCEYFTQHLDWHEKMKRRWKIAILVFTASIFVLLLIFLSSYMIAEYMAKGAGA